MPSKPLSELTSMIGESVVTVEGLHIEPGKVAEFASAIMDDNPVYTDNPAAQAQGFDHIPAPLTFTRTADFPRHRPDDFDTKFGFDLGFDPQTTLHGTQEYEFHRHARAGDVLSATATLRDVYRREGGRGGTMTFAVIEQLFEDEEDEPVVTVRSTYIETGGDR